MSMGRGGARGALWGAALRGVDTEAAGADVRAGVLARIDEAAPPRL